MASSNSKQLTETRATETRATNTRTRTRDRETFHAGRFDYQRLDVYKVSQQALSLGEQVAKQLPRGYGKLRDQLRRALLSSYLNIAEASSRTGNDRRARFRCSRGEASEAAAAVEAIELLQLAPRSQTEALMVLLGRSCAMLTRLAQR
jgi:four helix bundle protein